MNTQEIYDNIGEVCGRNVLRYIVVTKLIVKYNMGINIQKITPCLKIWKSYYYETY